MFKYFIVDLNNILFGWMNIHDKHMVNISLELISIRLVQKNHYLGLPEEIFFLVLYNLYIRRLLYFKTNSFTIHPCLDFW